MSKKAQNIKTISLTFPVSHYPSRPARNMPLELFSDDEAWSISMGVSLPRKISCKDGDSFKVK